MGQNIGSVTFKGYSKVQVQHVNAFIYICEETVVERIKLSSQNIRNIDVLKEKLGMNYNISIL